MPSVEPSMFTVSPAGIFQWQVTVYEAGGDVITKWVRGSRGHAKRVGYRLLHAA